MAVMSRNSPLESCPVVATRMASSPGRETIAPVLRQETGDDVQKLLDIEELGEGAIGVLLCPAHVIGAVPQPKVSSPDPLVAWRTAAMAMPPRCDPDSRGEE